MNLLARASQYHLTIFGRSLLLLGSEVLVNAILWAVAAVLFGRNRDMRQVLSLAFLAWTLGLRHALDADHISAIDNATRGLINLGQLPVTCGLFFSLGHSSIVIAVTIAIAISTDVYNRIGGVSDVGGIVGASVSGSFLFIVGFANTIILWKIIKRRRRDKKRATQIANGEISTENEVPPNPKHNHMLMTRILGPIITFVNIPWKMYPVGVLFGFGFDTASSVALIAISAIAKKGPDGGSIPASYIVILPFLFTAGMSMIDSADSVLMLYSYAGFPEHTWRIFELRPVPILAATPQDTEEKTPSGDIKNPELQETEKDKGSGNGTASISILAQSRIEREARVKLNVMSGLSIVLTLMSILVAFSISLITIMSLIGENCSRCVASAKAEDGGGLAGRWWRGWANAGEQSGYIGAAIVGGFLAIVISWYGGRWVLRMKKKREPDSEAV
ncbi:high-affinity nickel-transport protein-domain-containing protein [Cyathus striatus]|nr:high-affinity nickel-transport protein-domain-containing protein [Cyathus striatus]